MQETETHGAETENEQMLVHVTPFDWENVPEVHRERLRALVPNPALVDGYEPRDVDGIYDLEMFAHALAAGENVLLEGPTGTGKSLAARTFAAAHGLPYVTVSINAALDPATIWGRWTVTESGSLEYVETNAALVVRYGGVFVLEELNMIAEDGAAALHEVLSDSRIVTVLDNGGSVTRVSACCLFVATLNPRYKGTRPLTPALRRRFDWGAVFDYSPVVERALLDSESLVRFAEELRASEEVRVDISTPSLQMFERTARSVSLRFAVGRFVTLFPEDSRRGVELALSMYRPEIAEELGVEDYS